MFDGADADERADERAERVERGHDLIDVRQSPGGTHHMREHGQSGQHDKRDPFHRDPMAGQEVGVQASGASLSLTPKN